MVAGPFLEKNSLDLLLLFIGELNVPVDLCVFSLVHGLFVSFMNLLRLV
jgi:hypothetical protein